MTRKINHKINHSSSGSIRFILLTYALIIFVILLATLSFSYAQNSQSNPASDEAIVSLNSRLTSLENLQEAMISTSRGAFEQMNYVFTIVAAFFGLFALFFAYRQVRSDTKGEDRDQEMRSLVSSFQHNITTISSLITTLEQSFSYRKEIQEELNVLRDRAHSLEHDRHESDEVLRNILYELNTEAVRLFSAVIDRTNLTLEENRRKLEVFANKLTGAERTRNVGDALNPFCYYIRGLSNVGIYQYEIAVSDLEIALRNGRAEMAEPKLKNYADHDRENIKALINTMLISASYFQGVSYKNLGKYAESRKKFQEALNREPTHFQSKTYILQVMYFDIANVPFEDIEKEYEKTIEDFETLRNRPEVDKDRLKGAINTLRINQGSMYLKKAFYLDFSEPYKKYENSNKAMECFWKAYDELDNDLAMFAVAQAMEHVGSSAWRGHMPAKFYKKVMSIVKRRVAEDPDRLYSVMLYYMLAICARKLDIGDSAEVYLSQSRYSLKEMPSHVSCYSPISRIRLSRTNVLEELEVFEKTFK